MDFLRDPLWQFIGALLALIAIFVSIYLYWLQQKRKRITYDVVFNSPLLKVNENIKDNFEISFKGRKIDELHFVIIRLSNTGNIPIQKSDFDTPITFSLGTTANIVEMQIVETNPSNLQVDTEIASSSITIKPLLLNPRDFFDIKVLVTKYQSVSAHGRIVGVNEIQRGDKNTASNFTEIAFFAPVLFSVILLIGFFIILISAPDDGYKNYILTFIGGFIANAIFGLLVYFTERNNANKWQKKL